MHKGFTLIEFIVILSIFAIMAAVALFNFSGFRANVGVNNLTHDIALTVRQAQVFGWGATSGTIDAVADPERKANGVFFTYENGSWSRSFVLYSKGTPGSLGAYEGTPPDVVSDTVAIQGPNHIADIRTAQSRSDLEIDQASGTLATNNSQPITQDFSVAFSRPRPEAMFFSGFNQLVDPSSDFVGIYIAADATPSRLEKVVIISRLGEIEVQ